MKTDRRIRAEIKEKNLIKDQGSFSFSITLTCVSYSRDKVKNQVQNQTLFLVVDMHNSKPKSMSVSNCCFGSWNVQSSVVSTH